MVTDFFRRYAAASMDPDPAKTAVFYADSFIAAGPTASAAYQNDDSFLAWLRQVREFNARTGLRSMEVIAVDETAISDAYSLATVNWGAKYEKAGDQLIEFSISYILRLDKPAPKIIAYVSHADQEEVMRERGLL